MGHCGINWTDISVAVAVLTSGENNVPLESEYLILVPQADGDTVTSFGNGRIDPELYWMMEVANGDPAETKSIILLGGTPGQTPPEIVLPPGLTQITLGPARTQRFVYAPQAGWVALLPGVAS